MGCTNAYRTDRRHWTCRDRVLLPRLDRPPREVRNASGPDDRERRGARPLSEPCKRGCGKAGRAQVAAVTSMGGHFCIGELLPISPLPILNGIPEVDAAVKRGKFKTIGIIGTRMVMETRLYGAIS